ncbi:AzlD domain-containing protein [Liquorilactobacillus satsumensis]|nr:AzlD domain-containing protein [Liquorilactobacillus satsumensis]MCP9312795.1 AzlD domain-containing protein [Liquorilactobacillus satsumensis]MCP9327939.1 AzlD domain-containing protein [Liquorilactobacillus satsumensis]MCP9359191.1 AzlD domain-containing protein [Liquorilactobacillus satsumensis]
MPSFNFVFITILGCGVVTWLSRVIPFILLKKFKMSRTLTEFLSFVPLAIMAALWFESLFVQRLGHFPQINLGNLLASVPTVLSAFLSKNLLVIVVVGIISLAAIRFFLSV